MNMKKHEALRHPRSIDDLNLIEVLKEEFNIQAIDNNGAIELLNGAQMPSDAEILDARHNLLQKYQDNLYGKQRGIEYPSIKDQLDALYWDIANDSLNTSGQFFQLRKAVKEKYPKPQ